MMARGGMEGKKRQMSDRTDSGQLMLHIQRPWPEVMVARNSPTTIGRGSDCDLRLQVLGVSRHHAELIRDEEGLWRIRDLGSKNGTQINGTFIGNIPVPLNDGDLIEFARVRSQVKVSKKGHESDDQRRSSRNPGLTTIRSASELQNSWIAGDKSEQAVQRLQYLMDLSKKLGRASGVDEVFKAVSDAVFSDIQGVERLALLVDSESSGKLVPLCAVRKNQPFESDAEWISRTICDHVYSGQVALKTVDARKDNRLSASGSIHKKGIRGAMAVPVWDENQVFGVLYADATLPVDHWLEGHEEDITFFSALGNLMAYSVRRTLLAERLQDEERIRNRLLRYHAPAVVNQLLSGSNLDRERLIPKECEISVLFADLVPFTELSERLGPADVADLLSAYHEEMLGEIFDRNGTLDKFIGDSIMAFFGAPDPAADHADRCIDAACAMLSRLHHLNTQKLLPYPLQMRLGISSGPAVVGDIGSTQRIEYTALGPTVNLAARLESACPPKQILICDTTYQRLSEDRSEKFIAFGNQHFKGIDRQVPTYLLNDRS